MLKVEVQAVVLGTVHDGQIHGLGSHAVGIPLGGVADVAQLIQALLFQGEGLVGQGDRLIGQTGVGLGISLGTVMPFTWGGRSIPLTIHTVAPPMEPP